MTLSQDIRDEALRLGFPLAGITTPDPPPHWPTYENWLALGRNGQMGYLATERARAGRRDPRQILPECKSILVLGVPYPAPRLGEAAGEDMLRQRRLPRGRVAAYAWGMDYHLVIPERLKALAAFIEAKVGGPLPKRMYTDTGPLLERELAQRAGLGWIGRNTCLINPRRGSYFLLAEILLGIQLVPDAPFEYDRCGTCARCINACPTQCILPDRTLDARRCISYLTIELKDSVPPDLRPRMGNWVFGCDVCQEVCPWNRFADVRGDQAFAPRAEVNAPELTAEADLTPQAFNRKFKESPVQRARRRGYLRNVAIALGNSANPAAVPALEHLVQKAEGVVPEHAVWALDRIARGGSTWVPDAE